MTSDALWLHAAEYIDSDHPAVIAKAEALAGHATTPAERARLLHDAVRDGVHYDPYVDYTEAETFRASSALARGRAAIAWRLPSVGSKV